ALETAELDRQFTWVAMRQTSVRSGSVNPGSLEDAYALHTRILEVAPYYLSINALDVDSLELVYGFDFETSAPRDEIIFEALLAASPLAELVDRQQDHLVDVQPSLSVGITESGDVTATFEVKSRAGRHDRMPLTSDEDPISVFLTVRRQGPIRALDELR